MYLSLKLFIYIGRGLVAKSDSYNPKEYIAHQAPLSMGFSRQEYWSGLLFPSPGDLPDPGMEPGSLNWHKRAVAFQVTKTEQAVKICWATRLCFRQAGT